MNKPNDIVARFESLGDNCEFGFVQWKYGIDPGGLLRWAIAPIDPLISALNSRFEDFYLYDDLTPLTDDMVRAERYGLAFHTSMRSSAIDGKRAFVADDEKRRALFETEAAKMLYMREKLLDRLNAGEQIFIYKNNINVSEADAKRILAALRAYNEKNILFVVLADPTLPPVWRVEDGLYFGYIDRFAPYKKADDVSYERWLAACCWIKFGVVAQRAESDRLLTRHIEHLLRRFIFSVLTIMVALAVPAEAAPPPIGVNVVNPHRLSDAQQKELIDQLVAAGVETIRVPLPPKSDSAAAVRFIEAAAARSLHILVVVSLEYRSDAPTRAGDRRFPWLYGGHPLSSADPSLFKIGFGEMLAEFESKGIIFAGFELGNEINWAAFNAEFPIPGEQKILSLEDLTLDEEGQKIAIGFRRYVEVLKVLRELRDGSKFNRNTPIITAGLSNPGAPGPRPGSPADAVAIPAAVAYLQSLGAFRIADAIGIHSYSDSRVGWTDEDYEASLVKGPLAICGQKRSCWVTEWGVGNNDTHCPYDDSARATQIYVERKAFDRLIAIGAVTGLFYFAWNTESWSASIDPLSIYRCSILTDAGRAAIYPK